MKIGGIEKTTLLDFPSKIACTVFLKGCNFRCPFCYSPELVFGTNKDIPLKEVFSFLEKRKNQLDGVVICGGEPTCSTDLPDFCQRIKNLQYDIKLDTNGSNPKMLNSLIKEKLVDYVAMDIKAPKEKYQEVVGVNIDVDKIQESIDILKKDFVDYEFRTTFAPLLLKKEDIKKIAKWISPAKKYFLQQFRAEKTLDPKFLTLKPHTDEELKDVVREISLFFDICQVR